MDRAAPALGGRYRKLPPLPQLPYVAGNVYIHPTASVDSTAVVSALRQGDARGTESTLVLNFMASLCPYSWAPTSQLGRG